MRSIFEPEAKQLILQRLENLRPDTLRIWGSMNPAQMMSHCADGIDMAMGKINPPTSWVGLTVGRLIRASYFNDKPYPKNIRTIKGAAITSHKDFEVEKLRLLAAIEAMHAGGEACCTTHPHAMLGPFTPAEWGKGMYKHLDHHLRQFGA